ncbi:hypothetical protein ANN_02282 [Periplaneta americana]|uniref:Uncharacterized protein n=1 Tax=Periplaneta americana TaxID=6978 RepID=A0ABQ8TVV2_PERAM|nr:hypothetical protein ANN_02282 [Periplaneta americana]
MALTEPPRHRPRYRSLSALKLPPNNFGWAKSVRTPRNRLHLRTTSAVLEPDQPASVEITTTTTTTTTTTKLLRKIQTIKENTPILLHASNEIGLEENPDKAKLALSLLPPLGLYHIAAFGNREFFILCHDIYNLTISSTKTEILAFQGKTQIRCKVLIDDNIVEQVRDFKYLGCEIGNTRGLDQQRKLQNFNQICGSIKRTLLNKTRKETILKFYKVLAVPSLLYGSECWTLPENQKHKIEVSEMRFLRSVAGCRRTDRQYNETIRDELNIFNLNNKIKEYQEKYYEHIQRMPEYRNPKKILEYKPKGKTDRGRPAKRWRDQFL